MIKNKDLKIIQDFSYDMTIAISNSAVDMCFKDAKTYIAGIKEFAIRANILLYMTNVDTEQDIDFKALYAEVLYGGLWDRFLSINNKDKEKILTLKEVLADSIDKYFFAIIDG